MISIRFLNNDGGGFAKMLNVNEVTTVKQVFENEMGYAVDPTNYIITVNRQPVAADTILCNDDQVRCTPTKIEGAVL